MTADRQQFTFFVCSQCGTQNINVESCTSCGYAGPDDSGDSVEFGLTFAAAECPSCQMHAPAGPCPNCGAEVPPPDEPGKSELARQKAFVGAVARVGDTRARFERLPEGHVPVTADQFVAAMNDADVFDQVSELLEWGHRARELDFSDSSAIGGKTRKAVEGLVDQLVGLVGAAETLAWFSPPEPIAELRMLVWGMVGAGVDIAHWTLQILVAKTPAEAQDGMAQLQAILSGWVDADRFGELLDEAREYEVPDLDARAGLALGLEGDFTDELGIPDPVRMFSAVAREDEPFLVLARASARFFSHVLKRPPDEVSAEMSALALAALPLSVLDRPLLGHRIAAAAADALRTASSRNPPAVEALLATAQAQGDRIFAAAARIQRDIRLVATGQLEGPEDVVTTAVQIYKRLVEGAFRHHASLLLAALDIAEGREAATEQLMLGALEDRLAKSGSEVASWVGQSQDRELRNAEAHEDYKVRTSDGSVIFAGRTMDLDELDEKLEALLGCVAGLDAALGCFQIESGIAVAAPAWLSDPDTPIAASLLVGALLGAFAIEVLDVKVGRVVEIKVAAGADLDRVAAVTALAGIAALFPDGDRLRLLGQDAAPLVQVEAAAYRAFEGAAAATKDLAVAIPLYSARVAAGDDPDQVLADALALCAAVVLIVDLPRVTAGTAPRRELKRMARRIRFISQFLREHRGAVGPESEPAAHLIRGLRELGDRAAAGDQSAINRLGTQLHKVAKWVDSRGITWPPI